MMRHWLRRVRPIAWNMARLLYGLIDRNDIGIVSGLLLVAYGAWLVWPPAAFLIPGAVLLWQSLPARVPFILGPPERKRHDGEAR